MMQSKDYGVEVIRAYEFKRVGQVIYPTGILRERLIKCRFVKERPAPEDEAPSNIVSVNKKKPRLSLR